MEMGNVQSLDNVQLRVFQLYTLLSFHFCWTLNTLEDSPNSTKLNEYARGRVSVSVSSFCILTMAKNVIEIHSREACCVLRVLRAFLATCS